MTSPPNILFIVADDLNSWIGALQGHPQVQTPNIDRLAAKSLNFERAYCTAPYCNASRMSVFTGQQPHNSGIYHNESYWDNPERQLTYIETLKEQGYYCFGAGKVFHGVYDYNTTGREKLATAKWVEIHQHELLWDMFFAIKDEPMPANRPLNKMFNFDKFDRVDPWNHHFDWGGLPEDLENQTPDQKSVDEICKFLASPPPEKPFFCAAGLYKPHLPWYAPKRFFDKYPLEEIILPVVKEDDLDDVPDIAKQWALTPNDHEIILKNNQWRQAVQGYLATISYCDFLVGQLLDALENSPARDDTIIALWGDNGFHLGEKIHWRKFVLWEEATRVPLIITPPKSSNIKANKIDMPVSLVDIFPTLFDMAGLNTNGMQNVDGQSLYPLFSDENPKQPRPVLTTWGAGNHSLRLGRWRYTRYNIEGEELYHHSNDPKEWTNLVGNPNYTSVLDTCRQILNGITAD